MPHPARDRGQHRGAGGHADLTGRRLGRHRASVGSHSTGCTTALRHTPALSDNTPCRSRRDKCVPLRWGSAEQRPRKKRATRVGLPHSTAQARHGCRGSGIGERSNRSASCRWSVSCRRTDSRSDPGRAPARVGCVLGGVVAVAAPRGGRASGCEWGLPPMPAPRPSGWHRLADGSTPASARPAARVSRAARQEIRFMHRACGGSHRPASPGAACHPRSCHVPGFVVWGCWWSFWGCEGAAPMWRLLMLGWPSAVVRLPRE